MAKSQAEVVAECLGWDIGDIRANVYQPTRYREPNVYVVGDDYYAICAKKPKHTDCGQWEQAPAAMQFWATRANKKLWVAKSA